MPILASRRCKGKKDGPSYPTTYLSHWQWGIEMMMVRDVWEQGYNGKGTTIMVADGFSSIDHPDLGNIDKGISKIVPSTGIYPLVHGIACASIAGATGTKYVTGVAYGTRLGVVSVSYRVENGYMLDPNAILYGIKEGVDVYNMSIGVDIECPMDVPYTDNGRMVAMIGNIRIGTSIGRKGKGAIYVKAGGNANKEGIQTSYDPIINIHEAIVVGSVDTIGRYADYSTPGTAILVSAPGGLDQIPNTGIGILAAMDMTYNALPYTLMMNGTSAACPHISGLVAILLQVRPQLTWRDIQHILAISSVQVGLQMISGDRQSIVNGNGVIYSRHTGYGVPLAPKAVKLAKQWKLLPPMITHTYTMTGRASPLTDTPYIIEVDTSNLKGLRIETIILYADISGDRAKDIVLGIQSPGSNTYAVVSDSIEDSDDCPTQGYDIHNPMKVEAFRDELIYTPGKPWKIVAYDDIAGNINYLNKVKIEVHGYKGPSHYPQ